ncbi:TonB-dependent receptor [Caulobacter vibrioides]|uniref:TonB-dependent receptor plug domain-containing protein n=1 Tax=Caulobacter vibrioides TaxID=155892 RepID=UPI000BB51DB0|nr:TonB-dependent receptor [Caulobacter vibrioides]ATC23237.1 TonB-dependent receptor [Caulobacter vibrioides]AZH11445.1 TonB-dependent receptor [Caulobacter vibrioides]PLR13092.1 TonB-dependent receptor [Caulobacter vibrioides]
MMTKTMLLASAAAILLASAAQAADLTPEQVAAQAEAAQRGVLIFQPDFFAAQRPNTALEMVQRVPGFSVQDGSGARGFEGAVGNILINGARPASKNDTGSNVLSRTQANRVERIELIRGGAPGVDMQGYSVVVNVILKKGANRQSIVSWNTSQFDGGRDLYGGSYQFTATDGDKSWGVTLSDGIGSSDSNGPGTNIRRDSTGKIIRDEKYLNDSWGGGRSIRGNYSAPLAGGKIEATARFGVNDWNQWQTLTSAIAERRSNYVDDEQSGELGLTYTRPLAPNWALETRAIHSFENFESASTSDETLNGVKAAQQRFTAEGDSGESIFRAQLRHDWSKAITVETGGEVAYNMLDVKQAYSVGGAAVPLPSASVKVEELRGEAFSKATWRVNPRLTLEGGLRLETSTIKQSGDAQNEKSFFYAKPRFLATWTPVANNQLRFRFERQLGQLDFDDFAASSDLEDGNVYGGNVELKPEQRWITEIGYERRFWGEGIFAITYRHDEIIGVIDRLPLPGNLSAVGNIGDATLDRLSLNIVVPTDKLGITGGRFTFKNDWNETHVKDPTTGKDRPISGVRPTQANIGFQQDLLKYKTQWGINWLPLLGQGTYDVDQTSVWRGAQYYEAFAEYKPTPTLAIRAQLNLWDDFSIRRTVFANRGPNRAIAFVEDRAINPRTFWQLRIRQTF